ncbi:MAG: AAC(3) family N-acetyltransferase [Anaerolineales bacterium]|nr:AAC(3) family N-acetyltransferase [Anaerolineales bacterium]
MFEFQDRFRKDLLALGVRPGGLLLVHSSFRSFTDSLPAGIPLSRYLSRAASRDQPGEGERGGGAGGPETVIQGLLETLGPDGTLLMPALTWERVTPENPIFDIRHTPSNVGIIPETFRTRPGTLRSLHPTHSVCAAGPLAAELIEAHAADSTPCGPHSPFRANAERGGQILFLGCGLEANTTMHAVEEIIVPAYLFDPPIEYRLTLADGSERRKSYAPRNFRGWRQRYDRAAEILRPPDLIRATVAGAVSVLLDAAALWDAALAVLRKDPLFFVERVSDS